LIIEHDINNTKIETEKIDITWYNQPIEIKNNRLKLTELKLKYHKHMDAMHDPKGQHT